MNCREFVKFHEHVLLISILCFVIFLSGCIEECNNPAPGCCPSIGMTGCFGKSVILDSEDSMHCWELFPSPQIDCLEIGVNNCNGGILDVGNKCKEKVLFENFEIPSCLRNVELKNGTIIQNCYPVGIEIIRNNDGNLVVNFSTGNFAKYTPSKNDTIIVDVFWGQNKSVLTFIKTAELC